MNKYTDEQIIEAIKKAGGKKHPGTVYAWELSMYKKVLDALPEPATDDWQECRLEDIRKGDRVKVVDTHEAGDQTVYEGDVVQVSKGLVMTAHHQLHSVYNSKWYRIPAPVQHPDPAEHPWIIVHELNGGPVKGLPGPFTWADGKYVRPMPNHTTWKQEPHTITEWEPAHIVPKVVEDDR